LFAIPGIVALIIFVLARPQEPFPLLQAVPFLHLFTVLAVFGWVIDLRLRRLQPIASPTLPWVTALFLWIILGTAVIAPEQLPARLVETTSLFALYGTIAHGVQRLRTFHVVAGALACTCMFITLICFHQGLSSLQCVGGDVEADAEEITGTPDGRACENNAACRGPDGEPDREYHCEHVGLLGTYSIAERVRYRGELQDPNELALMISAGATSLLIGFALRKRTPGSVALCGLGALIALLTVYQTQSRGGLIAAMLVPGVYLVRRYGWRAVLPAAAVAVPLIMLGGRSDEAAKMSTELRYEAWATGLEMFKHSPIFGVGARQFGAHHFLTAHNAFVLTMSELGLPGMFLFVAVMYLSFKSLIVGLRALHGVPGTEAATVWGMALLASLGGILFQVNTLSFAYHSVLWIFFGMVGAWTSAIRHHWPEFRIEMTWRDVLIVAGLCVGFIFVGLPLFLRITGFA
jgi:hypothetical protein